MTIKRVYTFRIPRNDQGGVSLKPFADGLFEAGASTNQFMSIVTEASKYIAAGELTGSDVDDPKLQLGVTLVLGVSPDILGNPEKAAAALDEWLGYQWSEPDPADMNDAGRSLQRNLAELWNAKVETVSVQTSKATLTV